ncbi:hypothetical protein MC7420_2147 [Coleofasciculus chthonoplastes PCC 7420]|uniref:Uncharacterized protein n=1 Tax=Coleofasciculus chthonoplastes PCC 7420 TaxID=118168 RepID=B4VSP1_9CYAN|nr:hypothetical protein MC7420_2147 [Coleofasciculus chthonoplastes PCC 7420]
MREMRKIGEMEPLRFNSKLYLTRLAIAYCLLPIAYSLTNDE